jgi:hypothetical protein
MKGTLLFALLALLVFTAAANADFVQVGSIGTPHGTTELTGLDAAGGALFAVERVEGVGSRMYLIDPANGNTLREAILEGEPPGYPGMPLQFVSCAFNAWGDLTDPLGFDAYWVGDATGALLRYKWTDTYGPAHAGHCEPAGITGPVGLAESGDLIHILDHATRAIYKMKVCFGQPPDPMDLPEGATDPSGLCFHGGHMFVSDATSGAIYELDAAGALVETHVVESFAPRDLRGLAFIGDNLFAASDDNEILVYEFGEIDTGGAADVPEGTDIVVEPLPDELEIVFPAVADSGSLFVDVRAVDPCPAPEGVVFLPDFYDIATTASFEYIAQVAIITDEPLPEGVDPDRVRIFKRPSGDDCAPFVDVTVAPIELFPPGDTFTMGRLTRTLSEEDEFSIFVLAEDFRNLSDVVALKLIYLEEAIDAVGGFPIDPVEEMMQLLAAARRNLSLRRYFRAATLIDNIAEVALSTPEIPHLYIPDAPGSNLGGRIVARAHTLSFSIRTLGLSGQHEDPGMGMRNNDPPTTVLEASPSRVSVLGSNPSGSGFSVSLAGTGRHPVSVGIYSVKGELVETLLDNVALSGPQTLTWDGRDSAGKKVGNGVYFMVVRAGEESTTKKLILQR